ncbi:MAG TPA: tRNA pseudouridine(55) synthase TruB [Gammaproteobacteria bacterium]|nr:tRNA pseudouridine(55) synthase TruB [Gammaproteobacteria bacterium]
MAHRRKRGRPVNGVLLLDKPPGLSSNQALQRVKKIFFAQKAGHTGSLDPLATGMLPICFGEATKISNFLLTADKRYQLVGRLGVTTNTGDAEGEVTSESGVPGLDERMIMEVLQGFTGTIEQIPPMFSALKHQGERLYNLARQGIEVVREPRTIHIHELVLIAYKDGLLELDVKCSKGTYIRTLVEDIGQKLGCGAHVVELRRLTVGPFQDSGKMVKLDQLEAMLAENKHQLDDLLLPIDSALMDWPDVQLNADMAYYLLQGQPVQVPRAPTRGWVRLYNSEKQQFIGVGQISDDGKVAPKRLFHT